MGNLTSLHSDRRGSEEVELPGIASHMSSVDFPAAAAGRITPSRQVVGLRQDVPVADEFVREAPYRCVIHSSQHK
jgi:hypothetical protein